MMNVQKFSAATSREALRKVRLSLGINAVILSNKNVDGQVEILAMQDSEAIASPQDMLAEEKISFVPQRAAHFASLNEREEHSFTGLTQRPFEQFSARNEQEELALLKGEIRSMRGLLEGKMSELAWHHTQQQAPHKAELMKEMLATGFSASLARYVLEKLPEDAREAQGLDWIKAVLTRNLSAIHDENELLEKGGIFALVGPTGVGKTTTTAKLAARCVMRHGPSKLALITTDAYRIGAYEQLRIYGKILGVMVHAVKDQTDLKIALNELKNKHTVLIDTVGVSQRDKMVAQQIAMLSQAGNGVKSLLCLNATSTGETLSEVVRAYQHSSLAGCILTKLDEAATIGGALDIAIRQKLNIYYVASGQRVPEDLHIANKQYLVDRAFKLKRETGAYRFHSEELALLMSPPGRNSLFDKNATTEAHLA